MSKTIDAPSLVDEWLAKEVSRRSMLRSALAAAAVAMVGCERPSNADPGPAQEGAGSEGPGEEGKAAQSGGAEKEASSAGGSEPSARDQSGDRHLAGLGGGESHVKALDAALALVGGLDFISNGDSIYFKVNCNSGDEYPHSTSPELLIALAERCRDAGAKRILVGDRSFWGDSGTMDNLEENGIAAAARKFDGELYAFEDDNVEWVQIGEDKVPDWNGGFRLPKPVMEADHIINLPCVKTHFIAHFTMALKNGFGLVHPGDRKREGNLLHHDKTDGKLWRQIAQVNAVYTPSMNILDGYRALKTGGPNAGRGYGAAKATYADPGVIIASPDRIAADVLGIGVLQTLSPEDERVTQWEAWAQPQIEWAVKAGVGLTDSSALDVGHANLNQAEEWIALARKG